MLEAVTWTDVVLGMLLPGVMVAAAVAGATRIRRVNESYGGLIAAVALAAAVCTGYFALKVGPSRPRRPGTDWFPYLTLLAIPAGWVASIDRSWWVKLTVLGLTGVVAAIPTIPDWWTLVLLWSVILGYSSLLSGLALVHSRMSGARLALVLTATSGAAAAVLMQSSGSMAQIAAMSAATSAGAAVLCGIFGLDHDGRVVRGLVPGNVVLLTALMFSVYVTSSRNLSPACYAAIALAPTALVVTQLPGFDRLSPIWRAAIPFAAIAVPLTFAVVRAALA